jgi:uncharacterized protein YkwD
MWNAPQRLRTGYSGFGFENAYGASWATVGAIDSFNAWRNSPEHHAVILNQNIWRGYRWNALGVGIYKGYAVLWFGREPDPTGTPVNE